MAFLNMMEKMVEIRMEERFKNDEDTCKCERCFEDVKCIALNNLPPKYVSSSKGELFTKIDQQMIRQNVLDIDVAVINAIEFVKKRPRHD
ncbi:MAG: late competence development ComFB family protein [Oscillospiraceae bacterium]|jgi:competence protein ComFB|nr:late competence development ComFB family protein [Oscillospiraceae bacterium]